jgi:hypothetical protein
LRPRRQLSGAQGVSVTPRSPVHDAPMFRMAPVMRPAPVR